MSNAAAISRYLRTDPDLRTALEYKAMVVSEFNGTASVVVYADRRGGSEQLAKKAHEWAWRRYNVGKFCTTQTMWGFDVGARVERFQRPAPADPVKTTPEPTAPKPRPSAFAKWLDTYVDEADLPTEKWLEVVDDRPGATWKTHMVQLSDVIDAAKKAPPSEQAAIKRKIVQIDFENRDPMHFFAYLAKGLVRSRFPVGK